MSIKQQHRVNLVGRRLRKRYTVKKVIGRGGMGQVYLARDLHKNGKEVAIKYIPYNKTAPKNAPLREAAVLMRLDHDHLPKVRDVFRDKQGHYLVMDYISGETLNDLVKNKGTLSPERAARYVMSTLTVLKYLHSQTPPIIHRDIKPSNLILKQKRLMLVDFGIAKKLDPDQPTHFAIAGALTKGYAPPEQSLIGRTKTSSKSQTDARTDIFALGGVLYYLLTGEHPPHIETHLKTPLYHVDPRDKNPAVPDALAEVVMKATRMNKEHRYSSAEKMEHALKQALLLSAGGHQVVGPVLEGVAHDLQKTVEPSPKRGNTMLMIFFIFLLLIVVAVVAYLLLSG